MTVAARIVLFVLFVVAGVAKLADRSGTVELAGFGVPGRVARPLSRLLPLVELAVAVGLLVDAVAWWAGVAALVLLSVFAVGAAGAVLRGGDAECHCFGQLHVRPVGWLTVVRNLVLVAVAAVVVAASPDGLGASPTGWIGRLSATEAATLGGGLLLVGAVVALAACLVGLLRQNGRLLLRLDQLEQRLGVQNSAPTNGNGHETNGSGGAAVGTAAPPFRVSSHNGDAATLHDLLAPDRTLVLIFTDPRCGACKGLTADVARWQRDLEGKLRVALIVRATAEDILEHDELRSLNDVYVQPESEVSRLYGASATPMAVAITGQGVVASRLVGGADAIRSLVTEIASTGNGPPMLRVAQYAPAQQAVAAPPATLSPGDAAPQFGLDSLDGETVSSADLVGKPALVMFWNPRCGFCKAMLEDIRTLEHDPAVPRLVLISTDDRDANKAMALSSPVLLDGQFATAQQFGARGTPSAILLDDAGRVGSHLATGREQVLNLVRLNRTTAMVT